MEGELTAQRRAGSREVQVEQVAALFEAHHEAIFAYLYRLLNNSEWAHDLTQDTFLKVHESKDRLGDVRNQRAWVYRIASNLAFNALKRRRRFQWLPWREGDGLPDGQPLATDDPADRVYVQRRVAKALTALSPTYRAPLLLYSQLEFSVREVAEALEISEAAVKTRLYRAREMFREAYDVDLDRTEDV